MPNPAGLGTFSRILGHYVREKRMLTFEHAVNRTTGASADRFGLKGVGRLEPGAAADVVVFDLEIIADTPADREKPAGRRGSSRFISTVS